MARKMRQLRIEERFTQRNETIDRYMVELNRSKLLTLEEEIEYASRAQKGDQEAIDALVKANLRFVFSVAKQFSSTNKDLLMELVSQGNIGLIRAAKTFDPTRGFKFISYAVWYVRMEILKYLNDTSRLVRLPSNFSQDLGRIKRVEGYLMTKLGREPTPDEIVEEFVRLGEKPMKEERIAFAKKMGSISIPLEGPKGDDPMSYPIDWIESGSSASELIDRLENREIVERLTNRLNHIEREVVLRRHGIKTGVEEAFSLIGHDLGYSVEGARQIYTKAMRKIKSKAKKFLVEG